VIDRFHVAATTVVKLGTGGRERSGDCEAGACCAAINNDRTL